MHKDFRAATSSVCLGTVLGLLCLCLFCLITAPECKSSDAGDLDIRKRSYRVLPVGEKAKVLDFIRKEKKSYAEIAKMDSENESLSLKL